MLATADDGTALITLRPFGAGRVVLIGSDLGVDAYRGWEGAPELWARLLPTNALLEGAFGVPMPDRDVTGGSMARALNTLPTLEVPSGELLLAVIVAYILLIGPVSYLVLGRLDRRELAWVTAPLLVIVFSACSYGIGLSLRGSDLIVNQIAIVRSSAAGATATVETYAGVFSPSRATVDVAVEADALLGRMSTASLDGAVGQPRPGVASEQGDPARLRDLGIAAAGFEYLRADGVLDHQPALSVSWSYAGWQRRRDGHQRRRGRAGGRCLYQHRRRRDDRRPRAGRIRKLRSSSERRSTRRRPPTRSTASVAWTCRTRSGGGSWHAAASSTRWSAMAAGCRSEPNSAG